MDRYAVLLLYSNCFGWGMQFGALFQPPRARHA